MQTGKDEKATTNGMPFRLQPADRAGPTEKTLLQLAQERQLFSRAGERRRQMETEAGSLSPTAERVMEAVLWSLSLSMLHFTLDVLVQHQFAVEISWSAVVAMALRAWAVYFVLMYALHPHPAAMMALLPDLPRRFQAPLRQCIFFTASVSAGCYLIHISNVHGYLAVMKQSPPLGCLWVWSVMEMDLVPATLSVALAGLFLWYGGYGFR